MSMQVKLLFWRRSIKLSKANFLTDKLKRQDTLLKIQKIWLIKSSSRRKIWKILSTRLPKVWIRFSPNQKNNDRNSKKSNRTSSLSSRRSRIQCMIWIWNWKIRTTWMVAMMRVRKYSELLDQLVLLKWSTNQEKWKNWLKHIRNGLSFTRDWSKCRMSRSTT